MTRPDFQAYQYALTAHLRNPKQAARPDGTKRKRVEIYAELLYANLNGFLEGGFPVLRRVLKKKRWQRLTRAFFQSHRCRSPLFRDIPEAFLDFVARYEGPVELPPFTTELAHYEWLELKVAIASSRVRKPKKLELDENRPARINPTLELHAYRFPVHRISPDFQPSNALPGNALPGSEIPGVEQPPTTFLAVWRNSEHAVRFMNLSAAAARLLDELRCDQTIGEILETLFATDELRSAARTRIEEWVRDEVVLGNKSKRATRSRRATVTPEDDGGGERRP